MTADSPWDDDPFAQPEIPRPANFQGKWIREGRYRLPHPDDPTQELNAERASNFAKTISNTLTLNKWHVRKTVEGMATHPSLALEAAGELAEFNYRVAELDRTNGHSEEEAVELRRELVRRHNQEQQRIAEQAQNIAGAKEASSRGTFLHGLTVLDEKGAEFPLPEPWGRDMMAYKAILRKTGIQPSPEYTEKSIWIRDLNIAGTFDRLVRYLRHTTKWVVLDLKTGRDLQYGWAEIPIQLWCYAMGDVVCDPQNFQGWEPMPDTCTDLGLVLHLPQGEGRATLYEMDLSTQIQVPSLARPADLVIAVQKWRRARRIAKPVARIEVTEDGKIIDHPLTWQELMDLATSETELEDIASEAVAGGAWKASVTKRKNERQNILAS
jgi:hypothetical protein